MIIKVSDKKLEGILSLFLPKVIVLADCDIVCNFAIQFLSSFLVKITLLLVGKTTENYLNISIDEYLKRIRRYISFEVVALSELKNAKNMPLGQQKEKEGISILNAIGLSDEVILLDEKGEEYSSVDFAGMLDKKQNSSIKHLVFVVGGPYGFSPAVYARANGQLSLSRMTFSHQMIRLLFVEQVYRAMTILRGESYHHE